jgi:glycosyltransferase involved in cell wall biosynthesis
VVRVAIWKNGWLPRSETFIRDQVATYQTCVPITFGLFRLADPLTEPDIAIVRNQRLVAAGDRLVTRWPTADHAVGKIASRRLARANPDLIHAHFGIDGMTAVGASDALRLPLAVTFHGFDASASGRPGLGRYFAALPSLFRRSAALIAVSTFVADRLRAMGAPAERIHIHHIGVHVPARADLPSGEGMHVLFVGRLVPKKGADVLLRAFARLPQPLRSTPLVIVGEGHLRPGLEALAAELRLTVTFTGEISSAEVEARMRSALVLCVPSRTAPDGDSEGLPMVALEAASWGVPVIAANHAGIGDAVVDGESGLLFPEGDARALADALAGLLRDPEARRTLGAAARRAVELHFNLRSQTAELEQIYLTLGQ